MGDKVPSRKKFIEENVKTKIDFIVQKNDRIFYYQVAYLLTDEKTREREFGVYKSIEDNFPKYVLSMDCVDFGRDGVIHQNIVDFEGSPSEFTVLP